MRPASRLALWEHFVGCQQRTDDDRLAAMILLSLLQVATESG